jgi:ubiquinone/menaquinone biosynthesis C-methylase UbiE
MNKSNYKINDKTIQLLQIEEQDHVLEIGFGNGLFIKEIASKVKGTGYTGWMFHKLWLNLPLNEIEHL